MWGLKGVPRKISVNENEFVEIQAHCIVKTNAEAPKKAKDDSKEKKIEATRRQLVEDVFGPFIENADFQGMSQRMILASKNDTVVEINNIVLDRLARKGHKLTT